ncbi:TetR/AcrR family transcriptional regulator [Microbacterium hominis]|uniref:TetR/AcrR family transcriptional regulator n=1 Tax=Microbacterium TaxID=33882 RepID=UPI00168ABE20|nr:MULTISPECIES: TetR/AcrR family transcriptional regulator [Microbacterium]QOC25300.1 TetR/AcrR family transcriptional regulator [Microbacterium hominis]QOC29320.1 TetR/AcrR family transcriptional regulator [Microbacterium hominis]QYF98401.1 TetR/AcrR family transcriptional regulator [Microbacterium sp. PAMC21962]
MTDTTLSAEDVDPAPKLGRKRDHSRDPEILAAALDILAEKGYERMTVDMVAARARAGKATLYRRWPSKAELVIDAVACMKSASPADLPDTGSLRGDLVANIKAPVMKDGERKLRIMAGMVSLMSESPEFADAARAVIVEPRSAALRVLIQRAIERGEVAPDVDVALVAQVIPAMTAYKTLMLGTAVDRDYIMALVDDILLPALGLRPA